jgi:hypothetical protein
MRLVPLASLLLLLGGAKTAAAQAPSAEAPAAGPAVEPAQDAPAPEPGAPAPAADSLPDPVTAPESAPASAKIPEGAPESPAPFATRPAARAPAVGASDSRADAPALPAWIRAHRPLTLEARLGLLWRPESSGGFDDETHLGTDLGLSGYLDLSRVLAAGLEVEHASLGRGSALAGQNTVSTDFSVTSASIGVRAYPKRSDMLDLYVGLQLGMGIQHVSSAGTRVSAALQPGASFSCGASDSPGFQIGGGVGARLMISPRWGIGARVNATGRRLTGDFVGDCAQGLGTATTLSASLALGYDFDLDP